MGAQAGREDSDDFRMLRFESRCRALFERSEPARGPLARAMLDSLDERSAFGSWRDQARRNELAPSWVALGELPLWELLWRRLASDDARIALWALDCLVLAARDPASHDGVFAHLAAALSAMPSALPSSLTPPHAQAFARALDRLARPAGDRTVLPSFMDVRLALACCARARLARAEPGYGAWCDAFCSALPPALALVDAELGAELEAMALLGATSQGEPGSGDKGRL